MKKKIVSLCLVMALLAISAVGMYAYFTDTDTVNNTFTVGDVSMTLDEQDVDEYGEAVTPAARVDANEYLMVPGHEYTKDPQVHIAANSEECYVRMIVEVKDYDDLVTALDKANHPEYFMGDVVLLENLVEGYDKTKWETGDYTFTLVDANTATYEFRYYQTVGKDKTTAQDLDKLFTSFKIPDYFTNANIKALSTAGDAFAINVTADAIQADGFDDAAAAWTAFEAE